MEKQKKEEEKKSPSKKQPEEVKSQTASKKRKADFPTIIEQNDGKKLKVEDVFAVKGTLVTLNIGGDKPNERIAAFDLDSTIIVPKSGAVHGKSPTDWKLMYDQVKPKLNQLIKDGFRIVIFTNQGGVEAGHTTVADLRKKFGLIQDELNLPMTFLAATMSDEFRKPAVGMWEHFQKHLNGDCKVDKPKSFYCGDAAGRPKTATTKKDFTDTDLKFALNIQLPFKVPEEVFLDQVVKPIKVTSDIKKLEKSDNVTIVKGGAQGDELKLASDKQEVILFCGAPGSGKSTFWKNYLSKYVRVNNDTLKTPEKCMKVCEQAIIDGKSVVIDNTNKTLEQRNRYTSLAKKHKVQCRIFIFEVTKEVCMHNNNQRKINLNREHLSKKVSAIPIHDFFKNLEKPNLSEGYSEIKTIQFKAGPFDNDEDKKTYYSFS